GIRVFHVTGVQTCALPILLRWYVRVVDGPRAGYEGWAQEGITTERTMAAITERVTQEGQITTSRTSPVINTGGGFAGAVCGGLRSEERRVGRERVRGIGTT